MGWNYFADIFGFWVAKNKQLLTVLNINFHFHASLLHFHFSSEVTIIPTYDTDVLGYWVAENEELLTELKIDLAPSASRCTINLQVIIAANIFPIEPQPLHNKVLFILIASS